MIPPEAIDILHLSNLLDDAVIDWTQNGEDGIYVTSLAVPLWLEHDADPGRVVMRTYWPVRHEADEAALLRLANECNATLMLVQFWFDAERRRLFGQYTLPCRDGLDRRQFIRALRQFAEVFLMAAKDTDEECLLCDDLGGVTSGSQ